MTRAQIEDAMAGLEAEVAALEAAVYPDPEYRGCRACHHIYVGRRGDACPRCGAEPRPHTSTTKQERI